MAGSNKAPSAAGSIKPASAVGSIKPESAGSAKKSEKAKSVKELSTKSIPAPAVEEAKVVEDSSRSGDCPRILFG